MQYMLLIYGDEQGWAQIPEATRNAMYGEFFAYGDALEQAGAFVAGSALQPSSTATVVRVEDGETLLTDGPFAETKEQLLGFFIVECASMEQAIETAQELGQASSSRGSYEIRPLLLYRPGPNIA
jgi:hypothetical protein